MGPRVGEIFFKQFTLDEISSNSYNSNNYEDLMSDFTNTDAISDECNDVHLKIIILTSPPD